MGSVVTSMSGDGNYGFRAIALSVKNNAERYLDIRNELVQKLDSKSTKYL